MQHKQRLTVLALMTSDPVEGDGENQDVGTYAEYHTFAPAAPQEDSVS